MNAIRYQLKAEGIFHYRQEIVRITNTQKIVTHIEKTLSMKSIYVAVAASQTKICSTQIGTQKKPDFPIYGKLTIVSCNPG